MIDVVVGHGSPLTRGLLRAALEEAGCEVRDAASVTAVLQTARDRVPDVVLIEDSLCSSDDVPLVARMKQDPDLFPVAIVLVQEAATPREVADEIARGVHDVVLTPIRDADVVARVLSAARTKALQQEFLARGRTMDDLVYGDPLTGVFNRRYMFTQLGSMLAGARRHDRDLSVCLIDVDHFKKLNDTLGHAAGDEALVEVARRVKERTRREDVVGRVGGEEFLLILPDTGSADAAAAAEHVRAAVSEKPMILEGLSKTLTISVGWATWDGEETGDHLLRRADLAMYRAKELGRDRVAGPRPGRFERAPAPAAPGDG